MKACDENEDKFSLLLDEVFKEVDSMKKSSGFLEDVAAAEIDLALNRNEFDKDEIKNNNSSFINQSLSSINDVDSSSIIREGLTDSSDDEDDKYFEKSKYNDCGKNLKKLLKVTSLKNNTKSKETMQSYCKNDENQSPKGLKLGAAAEAKEKLKKFLEDSKCFPEERIKEKGLNSVEVDPVFHMRIVKPLISSAALKEKMTGRISIGTLKIKKFLESPEAKNVDWVTGGVITNKFSKTSQKGNVYAIWEISDLMGDIKSVTAFIFGSAYKEFWTTTIGTVVGILNPDILNNKNNYNGKNEATLRVDNPHRILIIGTSKDYGICRGKTKSGHPCRSVVNIAKCEFCVHHLQTEYRKASRRTDLQPPKIGNLMDIRRRFSGKNQSSGFSGFSERGEKKQFLVTGRKSSKLLEKDRNLLQVLSSASVVDQNVNDCCKINGAIQTSTSKSTVITPLSKLKTAPLGLASNTQMEMIDLNTKITKEERSKAKAYALDFVRKHGPIKAPSCDVRNKKTAEQIISIKRKLEVTEEKKDNYKKLKASEQATTEVANQKKTKLEKVGMNDKFFELMNAAAKNQELLEAAEKDQQERYFDKLETREKMENKMASIYKVECNAVRCLKCHYKAFSASDLCKREKHPLKVFKALKKFWKCSNCQSRTVSLELYPLHPCKTCGNPKWERTSMMPEKGPNLLIEPLSLRGMEEKFMGSVVKNAHLNLLVPDESALAK